MTFSLFCPKIHYKKCDALNGDPTKSLSKIDPSLAMCDSDACTVGLYAAVFLSLHPLLL